MALVADSCEITSNGFLHEILFIANIGMLTSLLSMIATFMIITYVFYKGTFSLPTVKPLLHLTIADFFLSYVWFSSNLDYMSNINANYTKSLASHCLVWQVLAEVLHLTTFGFTINYSVNIFLTMKEKTQFGYVYADLNVQHQANHQQRVTERVDKVKKVLYYMFWILPPLSMLPILSKIEDKHICLCERCVILIDVPRLVHLDLFYQSYGYVLLACALVASMISVVVLYILTLRMYWKTAPGYCTDRERKKLKNLQRRITSYVVVFLICWFPALAISIMKSYEMMYYRGKRLKQRDITQFYWLYLLQAILTPLQGFFNTIVYGWTRRSFRRASRPLSEEKIFFADHETDSALLRSPIDSEVEFSQSSLPAYDSDDED